jgi:hypothetical protein
MRMGAFLASAAGLALTMAAPPASAADFLVASGANANIFANANCTTPTASVAGHAPVSIERVCDNPAIGGGKGRAFASFGHLGADADAVTHSPELGAGMSSQADFSDVVVFSQTNGTGATTTDVSLDLALDGVLNAAGLAGARIEGFAILNGQFFNFVFERFGDGSSNASGNLVTNGDLINENFVQLRSATVTVPLNTPVLFRMDLLASVGSGGLLGSARSDFGQSSFKLPGSGPAFNLAEGFTVNAGDWLVDNRFIDPLAPTGGVPEPASWALLILGFGAVGAVLRRRRLAAA